MSKVWGYVLTSKERPSRAAQRKLLSATGVDMSEFGTCWADNLPPRPTRPRSAMTEREALIASVQPGDVVRVYDASCLGVSEADATWLLGALRDAGATVEVLTGDIPPHDYALACGRAATAMHMKRHRRKVKSV